VCAEELSSSSTLEQGERERKVSRLLTWPLIAGTNNRYQFGVKFHFFLKKKKEHLYKVIILFINISLIRKS